VLLFFFGSCISASVGLVCLVQLLSSLSTHIHVIPSSCGSMATRAGLLEPHGQLERHEGPLMWGCTFSFSLSSSMAEGGGLGNRHEKEDGKY